MSFADLLVQTCDVIHYGETGTDRSGSPTYGEMGRETGVATRIDQLSAAEVIEGRDTAIGTHRAFFLPGQTIDEFDYLEVGTDIYRVVGPSAKVYDATALHHLEIRVETVSDLDRSYP